MTPPQEPLIRLGAFLGTLAAMTCWESLAPRRLWTLNKPHRWVLLNATSLFNHGNVRLPLWLDRLLRLFVVTPDMHRVHHSIEDHETNSNYGFCLPWWDYMFRTYRDQPTAGHAGMTIGRPEFRDPQVEQLPFMLRLPFQRGLPPTPCRSRPISNHEMPTGTNTP